jgi:hypothetical protein
MYKNFVKDIFSLKMKIIDNLIMHFPDSTRNRVYAAQHDIMATVNEITNEYLEKSKVNENNANKKNEGIKNVTIE